MQTWIGIATFEPATGFKFKVIHEAIEEGPVDPTDPYGLRAAFTPLYALTLNDDGPTPSPLVVVGRLKPQAKQVTARPLLVDPREQTVRPMGGDLVYREATTRFTSHRGEVYWSCLEPATPHLLKIDANGTIKTATENFPEGDVIFHGDRLIVAPTDNLREYFGGKPRGKAWPQQWWLSEGLGKPLRPVWPTITDGTEMRRVMLRNSAVYGLIALTVPVNGNGGTNVFYQVELPPVPTTQTK